MIDHLSFSVKNYEESRMFYDATLKNLGYERLMEFDSTEHQVCGYGKDGKPSFWIGREKEEKMQGSKIGDVKGFHAAFLAPSVQAIETWYKEALNYGGTCNGKPGPRPEYHPGYYAAFIIDPNGWRLEAVLHEYQAPASRGS